ncbi:MAG TPA: TolC family protein [Bacteroidetes bacterium]|nr:TolC family protein [Bacteroidota bacterium]
MKRTNLILIFMMVVTGRGYSQTLDEYFRSAAEKNPGLRAAYSRFEAALQQVPQAGALPDPVVSFGYFISPAETRLGPQRAKFSLTQMFPWFGTLKACGEVAALQAEARYQEFLNARDRLYYQVASAYYPLVEINRWKALEQENIRILRSYKNLAVMKLENDAVPVTDVLRVDLMLNEANTRLHILNDREKPLLVTFNNLLGRESSEPVEVADSLRAESLPVYTGKDSLLQRNPVLAGLDMNIRAQRAGREVARKKGLPGMGVGLDYVVVGQPAGMSSAENGRDVVMPMISVSIPLFRKKYRAAQREARLLEESFTRQKENTFRELSSEYEQALFDLIQQFRLVQLYEEQIKTTRQSLSLLLAAYRNSGKEFEEVLRMQQKLLQYEKSLISALSAFHIAQAKIDYLTSETPLSHENE